MTRAALVDMLHLMADLRPCVRLRATGSAHSTLAWCDEAGLEAVPDDPYVFVGSDLSRLIEAAATDASPSPHVASLGRLFGYPDCCSEQMANAGEAAIDAVAERAASWELVGQYQMLAVGGYRHGEALLSHVPCGPRCDPSLEMAEASRRWIVRNDNLAAWPEPWTTWRRTIQALVPGPAESPGHD